MRARKGELTLLALLLAALAVRLAPWLANLPLHHDEALYGTWARSIADGSDPFLLVPWVDKPPLVMYLLATSIRFLGTSELALRVPGMIASLLTVLVTFGLARRIYGERAALVAAALFALSPFAILFAPTAFTDPWLTLFTVAACWAALAGRPGWAGALAGLAAASKQQGVFAIPLVVALVVVSFGEAKPRKPAAALLRALGLASLGFALVFGAVTYWDSLRWHNRPSYWDQSLQTYGGVAPAAVSDWPRRTGEWAQRFALLFGGWWLTLPMLIAAAVPMRKGPTGYRNASSLVLSGTIVAYLVVHVVFTFQPWDRYLLPVLPLICALAGGGTVLLCRALKRAELPDMIRAAAGLGAAAVAVYATGLGVTAAIPVGSDVGAYRGVAEAARFLAQQPGRTTVYHDHLGWHLDYYLYGLPVTRSWFDSPQKLASEAARVAREEPDSAQWLALPSWEEPELDALEAALGMRGFEAMPEVKVVAPGTEETDLTLYRLLPTHRATELAAARDPDAAQ